MSARVVWYGMVDGTLCRVVAVAPKLSVVEYQASDAMGEHYWAKPELPQTLRPSEYDFVIRVMSQALATQKKVKP